MKKLCILAAVLCSFASAFGQMSSTGSITATGTTCGTTNACIVLNLFNNPSVSTTSATVVISGTFSATLQFEASTDGVNFSSILGSPLAGGAAVSSATSTGTWSFGIPALVQFRVRASAYASGTATITIQASGGGSAASAVAVAALFGGPGSSGQYLAANGTIQSFSDVGFIPAANCNNATAGDGWSIGSGGTVTCRAGTNNLGGFISITDTAASFATFQVSIPEDWNTLLNPYIRFKIASTDATNAHTIIPSIQVACYKGDGSTTDDVAANAAHSLSTVTLNGVANRFWSTSNVQMNSTDVTGCVAGALMQVTVGRATDTATNAEFYGATITFPRLMTVQAN